MRQNIGGTIQDTVSKMEASSGKDNIDANQMEDNAMGIPPTQRISQVRPDDILLFYFFFFPITVLTGIDTWSI